METCQYSHLFIWSPMLFLMVKKLKRKLTTRLPKMQLPKLDRAMSHPKTFLKKILVYEEWEHLEEGESSGMERELFLFSKNSAKITCMSHNKWVTSSPIITAQIHFNAHKYNKWKNLMKATLPHDLISFYQGSKERLSTNPGSRNFARNEKSCDNISNVFWMKTIGRLVSSDFHHWWCQKNSVLSSFFLGALMLLRFFHNICQNTYLRQVRGMNTCLTQWLIQLT